jgi:hypothetical protein
MQIAARVADDAPGGRGTLAANWLVRWQERPRPRAGRSDEFCSGLG